MKCLWKLIKLEKFPYSYFSKNKIDFSLKYSFGYTFLESLCIETKDNVTSCNTLEQNLINSYTHLAQSGKTLIITFKFNKFNEQYFLLRPQFCTQPRMRAHNVIIMLQAIYSIRI